jgi:hypothetical protein
LEDRGVALIFGIPGVHIAEEHFRATAPKAN